MPLRHLRDETTVDHFEMPTREGATRTGLSGTVQTDALGVLHPRVVMETLGHSQVSLTLDTYSNVLPAFKRRRRNAWTRRLAVRRKTVLRQVFKKSQIL